MKQFQYYLPAALQKIGYVIFFVLYKMFLRIEIRGKEHIQKISTDSHSTQPVILASNHTSELDVTALPLLMPFFSRLFPIYFVTNKTEKYKTFGWRSYVYGEVFFNMLGGYAVHSGSHDYAVALEDHVKLLRQKNTRTLWIAPEGMRTRDGRMNPARGGLGYLVYTTNALVVPIAIDTFFNMNAWDFFTRQRKVVITVGAPMTRKEIFTADVLADPSSSQAHSKATVEHFRSAAQIVLDKIGKMMD